MSPKRWRILHDLSSLIREHAESLILVLILALALRWLVVSTYVNRSEALYPSLLKGDVIMGLRLPFGVSLPGWGKILTGRPPARGELAIYDCPGGDGLCLKRVVAIAGDRIEMQQQRLVINGEPCQYEQDENGKLADTPWLKESCLGNDRKIGISGSWASESWGPVIVPPGQLYVLSDNRPLQDDSRSWGVIPESRLRAVAVRVIISLDWGVGRAQFVRWPRTFMTLN